jgi:glycosyltransferase involved in cell wall biosynthesis
MTNKPVIVFVANRGYALTSSRTLLIRHFLSSGWNVVLATADDAESRQLVELGAHLEPVTFKRGGLSVRSDMTAYRNLCSVYRRWRPALIQQFHAKPVILGSLAAQRVTNGRTRVVNTITGLGHAFVTGGISSHLAGMGYRAALPKTDACIFQNSDDQAFFLDKKWISRRKAHLIAGSGVDIRRFSPVDRSGRGQDTPVVVMLGRLLNQKGIPEFVEVSRRIRKTFPKARFLWAGEEDPVHPDAVSGKWLQAQAGVEYPGRLSDVFPLLAEADLLLFPSYREGVPRVIMEAAATCLPTVAFHVPGVREVVRDERTGYLIEDRNVDAMTEKVEKLLKDEKLRLWMGQAARKMVEQTFDVRAVQEKYLQVYRELGLDI